MGNINRTRALVDKLTAGNDISKEDALDALMQLGIGIGSAVTDTRYKETVSTLNNALTDAADAVKAVDYTQTGIETDEGDMYEINKEIAQDTIDNLSEQLRIPLVRKKWGDSIDLAIRSASAALAYQDTMQGQRAENVDELRDLLTNYTNLVESDPLLENEKHYDQALDLIDASKNMRSYIEGESGKKILMEHQAPLQTAIKEFQILTDMRRMDMDESIEGMQVDMKSEYSPYLKQWMQAAGLEAGEEVTDEYGNVLTTLTLPEGEKRVSTAAYKDAITAFGKWETVALNKQATELKLKADAKNLEIFDMVENYVADPAKASIAMLIGHGRWGDIENEPLEDLPAFTKLTPKNQTIVTDAVKTLDERGATVKYRVEENALQTRINSILPGVMRNAAKLSGVLGSDLADRIEFEGTTLNNSIRLWNSKYKADDDMDLLEITVLKPNQATLASVTDSKVRHVELLENFIKKEIKDEGMFGDTALSADPTGNIRALIENPNASIEAKWGLMNNLVTDFLGPQGERRRPGDVDDMFDEDADRVTLFYNTLKSFQKLIAAEPLSSNLIDQIGLDLVEPQSNLTKAMKYALPFNIGMD